MLSILFNKKVIAISQSVKESLIKFELVPSKKIFVLPNGIDYQKFNKNAISKRLFQRKTNNYWYSLQVRTPERN